MCFDKADRGIGMKSDTTIKGLKVLSLIENRKKVLNFPSSKMPFLKKISQNFSTY